MDQYRWLRRSGPDAHRRDTILVHPFLIDALAHGSYLLCPSHPLFSSVLALLSLRTLSPYILVIGAF